MKKVKKMIHLSTFKSLLLHGLINDSLVMIHPIFSVFYEK